MYRQEKKEKPSCGGPGFPPRQSLRSAGSASHSRKDFFFPSTGTAASLVRFSVGFRVSTQQLRLAAALSSRTAPAHGFCILTTISRLTHSVGSPTTEECPTAPQFRSHLTSECRATARGIWLPASQLMVVRYLLENWGGKWISLLCAPVTVTHGLWVP